jgi:ElaB/YqjD/DUF883 family membrane-anchored ribosome-binding protein
MAIWRKRTHARNIEARLDALRSDFLALQKDMRGLATGVGAAASDEVHTTNRAAENALDSVSEWTHDNIGSLQDSVRRQPLAAAVLFIGAGALIGALLSRR